MKLQGSFIATITPMEADGQIDYLKFAELLEWYISQGSDGIVVAGSTGEAATLSYEEKINIFAFAKEVISDRVLLIAGTGTNCTRSSVELTLAANDIGIEYSLLTCPYYNKPTQLGLLLHYQTIAEAVPGMQHILYNIPGRSIIQLDVETIIELSQLKNIIGLKDSGSNINRIQQLRLNCPENFALLSGDDDFTLECLRNGGDGVISVVGNVCPLAMYSLVHAALAGDMVLAHKYDDLLKPLYSGLFCQSNPIPVKALLYSLNKINAGIRLPLTWLPEAQQVELFNIYSNLEF